MTAPQSATPGSDSVRAQIAEEMEAVWPDCSPKEASHMAVDLVSLVERLRAEAKAEALEEAADDYKAALDTVAPKVPLSPLGFVDWLRIRAAAYRTNPSSEETHRQHRMDADCWCRPVEADNGAWDHNDGPTVPEPATPAPNA